MSTATQNPSHFTHPVPPTPPAPPIGVQVQSIPLEQLQARVVDLSLRLASLKAEKRVLDRRNNNVTTDSPEHAAIAGQRAVLADQITKVEMDLESAKAQIGGRLGISSNQVGANGLVEIPQSGGRNGPDPDLVIGLVFVFVLCVAFPLAIAYARRIWRGKPKETSSSADESSARMTRLEHAIDAVAIEIERVAEGQRFVTKILAERPLVPAATPNGKNDMPAEERPVLALGAGQIEPIVIPERQSVRQ